MAFNLKRDKCTAFLQEGALRIPEGNEWGGIFSVSETGTRGFCYVHLEILVFPEFAKRRISRILAGEKLRR